MDDAHATTKDERIGRLLVRHRALTKATGLLRRLPVPHGPELGRLIALNEDVLRRNERFLAAAGITPDRGLWRRDVRLHTERKPLFPPHKGVEH